MAIGERPTNRFSPARGGSSGCLLAENPGKEGRHDPRSFQSAKRSTATAPHWRPGPTRPRPGAAGGARRPQRSRLSTTMPWRWRRACRARATADAEVAVPGHRARRAARERRDARARRGRWIAVAAAILVAAGLGSVADARRAGDSRAVIRSSSIRSSSGRRKPTRNERLPSSRRGLAAGGGLVLVASLAVNAFFSVRSPRISCVSAVATGAGPAPPFRAALARRPAAAWGLDRVRRRLPRDGRIRFVTSTA